MMGQFSITSMSSSSRVMFDEESQNGLILGDTYVPVEVLIELFWHADCKTLLNCQLVCKRWKMVINHVWRKKTEQMYSQFPTNDNMPWIVHYLACKKKPYGKNLLKNHSGTENMKHWTLKSNGGDHWIVEEPPVGIPKLPQTEPAFIDRQTCFTTSYALCCKRQQINLRHEGIHPYIMDTYQPPIVVSEWYGCRWDCPAKYEMKVKLMDVNGRLIKEFEFEDTLQGDKQNQWLKVSHVFQNYGFGVRSIIFEHSGRDGSFWKGHYGSKMTGTCVSVKVPENCIHTGML